MEKQSSNVADSNLSGEESASNYSATDLKNKNLFEKLNNVFQNETVDEAYSTYSAFISFKRTDHMNMSDYILEYQHLYHKIIQHDIKLLDAILTFQLLDGTQVTDDDRS